jgi:hypothetical protein
MDFNWPNNKDKSEYKEEGAIYNSEKQTSIKYKASKDSGKTI